MMVAEETTGVPANEVDAYELAARVNVRLAQLAWKVLAEVETDAQGFDRLTLRPVAEHGSVEPTAPTLRVGHSSIARANVIESILVELRARGWNRAGERPSPRADVLWCAPA